MLTPTQRFCRLLAPAELTECLQWALPRYPLQRASWILSQLTSQVQAGQTTQIVAGVASVDPVQPIDRQHVLAAAVAIPQVGGAATLLLLQATTFAETEQTQAEAESCGVPAGDDNGDRNPDRRDVVLQVLAPVLGRLREAGVTFLQAACDDSQQGELLRAAGFQPLADLSLMALPAEAFTQASRLARQGNGKAEPASGAAVGQWVKLHDIGEHWSEVFSSVAIRTFIETRDCPLLSDLRTAQEIVESYRAAAGFDPALTRLLRLDDRWAGCLVLTRHVARESSDPTTAPSELGAALELTYMGLVPEYRRQGLSASLLAETRRGAEDFGASQVVLAVDRKNEPATVCYRRWGWQEIASESVWGMRI